MQKMNLIPNEPLLLLFSSIHRETWSLVQHKSALKGGPPSIAPSTSSLRLSSWHGLWPSRSQLWLHIRNIWGVFKTSYTLAPPPEFWFKTFGMGPGHWYFKSAPPGNSNVQTELRTTVLGAWNLKWFSQPSESLLRTQLELLKSLWFLKHSNTEDGDGREHFLQQAGWCLWGWMDFPLTKS